MEAISTSQDPPVRTMRVWSCAAFIALFAFCCFIRLYDLGRKSIMHDETLFVFYTYDMLYLKWTYGYFPILHGPAMLHLQSLVFHLFGVSDYTMRLGCALLGVAGFFWIWKLKPWLGSRGTWVALLFYTVSPGIVYYQRFFRNDALYLFNSLWIVTSLAWWWRTRKPGWLVSGLAGCMVLFTNKESSLFVYFSIVTFFLLMVIHDLTGAFLAGKDRSRVEQGPDAPRFPNPFWPSLLLGGFIVLCLTQIFEGIIYDNDVVETIGHNWVLKDIRSIPLALGWVTLDPTAAPDAGGMIDPAVWRKFYVGLAAGLLAVFFAVRFCIDRRIGKSEFLNALWNRVYRARYHLVGALGLMLFIYIWMFTTGFVTDTGVFEIYAKTWSYWGGQHEWGRIVGPFHQHTLNMLIYELPSVLIVLSMWVFGLFRMQTTRHTAIAFFLIIVAYGAFHKLLFSGMEYNEGGRMVELVVPVLKNFFIWGALFGVAILLLPRSGRILVPVAFFGMVIFMIAYFGGSAWEEVIHQPLFRHGDPVKLSNRHVDLLSFMEIQFNFDNATSVATVVLLIFFATIYTWKALERGERFHAFLVWWTVTATGAACYAREGVPQVGIHAMLPLILLASSFVGRVYPMLAQYRLQKAFVVVIGCMVLWNSKATFMLNFEYPDDPREKMVYGPQPPDIQDHCYFVQKYYAIAPVRVESDGVLSWIRFNNDTKKEKQVRIGVTNTDVVWEVRWYLRQMDWQEDTKVDKYLSENFEFMFIKKADLEGNPEIAERYHTIMGNAIRFWLPRPLDFKKLGDIWKEWIPGHYLDASPQAVEAHEAKKEWMKIWRYLNMRDTFDGSVDGSGGMSATQYIFCIRKDLY